ncbi:SurA N-terminal domain-containing protein [Parvibium lacunae]|uniref:Periplasmic chaperone PpiD n=1 Tax=Parvibium lacunae TaxID=1888893 RepID=A0A368L809_9BURK|nr:SurA N-terminal domain-containing protein [Parvibium lacunae]RCS59810.1 peptidylprolyl isomerase [Parvibium lacunae]
MLEAIRKRPRLMYLILLVLIFPPFVMFGLEGFARMNEGAQNLATIDGKSITKAEFDEALRNRLDELRNRFGGNMDVSLFNTPALRKAMADQMVREQLQLNYQNKALLAASDQQVYDWLAAQPQFRGADGKFDAKRYKELLAARGMSEPMFEARLRASLGAQLLPIAITSTDFVPTAVANHLYDTLSQQRSVREWVLPASSFLSKVTIDEPKIKAYYDANVAQFKVEEQADIEYLVLDEAAVANLITVSDADVAAFYEQNKRQYATPEQRRASHILIQAEKSASATQKAEAKTKALSVLAEVRRQPARFADLAKQYSDDPGSKTQGGDLSFFGRGAMVPAFDQAVFAMKEGQISDLIETEYGFHIIQLTAIKPGQSKPLAEVKDALVAELRKQQAVKKFAEFVDQLNELVFKHPENFALIAQQMKLPVQKLQGLTRQTTGEAKLAVYQPKFLQAIFSEESIKSKKIIEPVEVGAGAMITGRVLQHRAATTRPLVEVASSIRTKLTQDGAQQEAEAAGAKALKSLQETGAVAGVNFSTPKTVSREQPAGYDAASLKAIFQADQKQLPAYKGIALPGQGYRILRIESVVTPTEQAQKERPQKQQQLTMQLAQVGGESAMQSLFNQWRSKAKVKLNEALLDEVKE